MTLIADDNALTGLFFEQQKNTSSLDALVKSDLPIFSLVEQQLNEYLQGTRKNFDIPLNPTGTDFQRNVWKIIAEIPYGNTVSYRYVAERIGKPRSVRAVARAIGSNPMLLLIPCHRVIGSNGKLVGYAGGLERKQHLLHSEKKKCSHS
jgi:methylated-DNA-[protein]-cysteine S-methyltransferase